MKVTTMISMLERIEERLDEIDDKLESTKGYTKQSMEWTDNLYTSKLIYQLFFYQSHHFPKDSCQI